MRIGVLIVALAIISAGPVVAAEGVVPSNEHLLPDRFASPDERAGLALGAPSQAEATVTASPPPSASETPLAQAVREALGAAPAAGTPPVPMTPAQTEERQNLEAFYAARGHAPLWTDSAGMNAKARALTSALTDAAAYGLDPDDYSVAGLDRASDDATLAALDIRLTATALRYARDARGGRIAEPAQMLNSNLDRKPQLHEPAEVLKRLAAVDAAGMADTLARLHPVHEQFWRLRDAFLKETGGNGRGRLSAKAKRLRANMEFWRWMWDDLGQFHVFNNIPEFMQRVVHDGRVVRSEKIVVGEIGKQSSVFSRPLKEVVLRPRWRVPESIMVHELWPSLLKGGGLMRQHGLEITTKSGEPRDWRQIDWSRDDIRNYHVWQPPGRKSSLGFVKFSFPSQHTIFMHDTPDKWMFNARQRTLSHGCLRVKNPMGLTELVLGYERGWDRARIEQQVASGPLDNDLKMTKHIPIHIAYFTAWADDDGKVRYFADIYGHEKRVTQALDGDWKRINKGRNHLAPPQPRLDRRDTVAEGEGAMTPAASAADQRGRRQKKPASVSDMIVDALGF